MMKKSITTILFLLNAAMVSAQCGNIGFEYGDYTGWTGQVGLNLNSVAPLAITGTGIFTNGPDKPVTECAFFTLVDGAAAVDTFGNFPALSPFANTWSERMGGIYINYYNIVCNNPYQGAANAAGEILEQTFAVTPSNAALTIAFAIVLNTGGATHTDSQQPYFHAELLDSAGNHLTSCFEYYIQATSAGPPPGFIQSSIMANSLPVYYLPWTSNTLVLSDYIGQNIKIRFTVAGCVFGGHFGYAYVDAFCNPTPAITQSGSFNCSAATDTLTAPSSAGATYAWSGPGIVGSNTTQTIIINQPGSYTVTVTPSPGCSWSTSITVTQPPPLSATICSQTNLYCYGDSNACATVCASGGSPGYFYLWSTNDTGDSICNLHPGIYSVTVYDANGCTAETAASITQPATPVSATASALQNVSCNGGYDGVHGATASGGTPPYTYMWSPGGCTAATCSFLPAGCYTVSVVDANGCMATDVTCITQPPPIPNPLSMTDATCSSCCDGVGVSLAAGGPYTYLWLPSLEILPTISNLCPGIYSCCITDANGCSACSTDTVSYPTSFESIYDNGSGIVIQPNPFSHQLKIHSASNAEAVITLYDYTGKIILSRKSFDEEIILNTEGVAEGLYLLRVESGGGVKNYKVVKQE